MILECPECHARFLVADALLAPAGRSVRCGSCSHQWHAPAPSPSFAAAVEAEVAALEGGVVTNAAASVASAKPAKKSKLLSLPVKPFKIAVPALAAVWLAVAYIAYSPMWSNNATRDLAFNEVRMEPEVNDVKTTYVLSGGIVNHGAEQRIIPSVRVELKTSEGKAFWSREYPVNKVIKGGEVWPFKIANVETSRAADVAEVVVDIGNGMQLMVR